MVDVDDSLSDSSDIAKEYAQESEKIDPKETVNTARGEEIVKSKFVNTGKQAFGKIPYISSRTQMPSMTQDAPYSPTAIKTVDWSLGEKAIAELQDDEATQMQKVFRMISADENLREKFKHAMSVMSSLEPHGEKLMKDFIYSIYADKIMIDPVKDLLTELEYLSEVHAKVADHYEWYYKFMMIPTIIIAAVSASIGGIVPASIMDEWGSTIACVLGTIITILLSIIAFCKWQAKAQNHDYCASQYDIMEHRVRIAVLDTTMSALEKRELRETVEREMVDLAKTSNFRLPEHTIVKRDKELRSKRDLRNKAQTPQKYETKRSNYN